MEIDFVTLNSTPENLANDTMMTGCIRKNIETASLFETVSHGETFGVKKKPEKHQFPVFEIT